MHTALWSQVKVLCRQQNMPYWRFNVTRAESAWGWVAVFVTYSLYECHGCCVMLAPPCLQDASVSALPVPVSLSHGGHQLVQLTLRTNYSSSQHPPSAVPLQNQQ